MRKTIHERIIKLKSQPRWVVKCFILVGVVLGLLFAFVSHPIGGTNAQTPTTATLLPGSEFVVKIKTLAKGGTANLYDTNTNIEYIVRTGAIDTTKTRQTISVSNSSYLITAWYDSNDKTIYYYTQAEKIYMNANSSYMFYYMKGLKDLDLSEWDTSSVTNMNSMFSYAQINGELMGLSDWDTSSVTNMGYMFSSAQINGELMGLSEWDTSSVTNMYGMFSSAQISGELMGLSNWDTSSVTDMSLMFSYAQINGELMGLSDWDTSSVTNMSNMFSFAQISGELMGLSDWNTSSVTNMSYMFHSVQISGELMGLSDWDTSSVTNMNFMFHSVQISGELMGLSDWDISSVTNMNYMFSSAQISGELMGLSNWDTSSVTNMGYMFSYAQISGELMGLSNWDTSSVTNMNSMFYSAQINGELMGLSEWDTSSVTIMNIMFSSVQISGELMGLSNWDISSVTDMSSMFSYAQINGELMGLSDWDTSSVTDMSSMFSSAQINGELMGLSDWDTSSVTNMSNMFSSAQISGELMGLSEWDTSSVTNMNFMFSYAQISGELNLSNWDTSSVTDMNSMFSSAQISGELYFGSLLSLFKPGVDGDGVFNSSQIEKIYVSNISNGGNGNGGGNGYGGENETYGWFFGSTVVGQNGTVCNDYLPESYLRVDRPGEPGCFWEMGKSGNVIILDGEEEIWTGQVQYGKKLSEVDGLLERLNNYVAGKEGYTYSGLYEDGASESFDLDTVIFRDLTLYINFEAKEYTITFVDGSGEEESVVWIGKYGSSVSVSYPTWTKVGYTISWDKNIPATVPGDNTVIIANWVRNEYLITFVDGDGEIIQTGMVEYGEMPEYTGETPTKTATAQYTYTFNNTWSPAITGATEAATYTAQFDSAVNEYLITFVDGDGEIIQTGMVEYGEMPEYTGETPTKTATAQYTYTFNNTWSPAITGATEAATYTAQFDSAVNEYEIIWNYRNSEGDMIIVTGNLEYGEMPVAPMLLGTCQSDSTIYTFMNWNPAIESVVGDTMYTAQYDSVARTYTVSFTVNTERYGILNPLSIIAAYGSTISTSGNELTVGGQTVTATPNTGDAQYSYEFNRWENECDETITHMCTITAVFDRFINQYTITFVDEDETTVLGTDTVNYGGSAVYTGETPTKTAIDQYTYVFDDRYTAAQEGIVDDLSNVIADRNVYARYTPILNQYTITFVDGSGENESIVWTGEYGVAVSVDYPTWTKTGYTVFWDREIPTTVSTEDIVITASWIKKPVSGGKHLKKDNCPGGDYSDSYYDGDCGSSSEEDNNQHHSAEIVYDVSVFNPQYSDEMNKAYQYSYYYGITTKAPISSADIDGNLTRIAMAKMLSQYAINVLGMKPDKSKNNQFKDVSDKLDGDYDDGVTLAYQLGIMGINMPNNEFRPNDLVPRAEFATALSRLLYQTSDGKYEKTSKYYVPHINKLAYEGILTNTDPHMKELRGYVMLMLMRSAE